VRRWAEPNVDRSEGALVPQGPRAFRASGGQPSARGSRSSGSECRCAAQPPSRRRVAPALGPEHANGEYGPNRQTRGAAQTEPPEKTSESACSRRFTPWQESAYARDLSRCVRKIRASAESSSHVPSHWSGRARLRRAVSLQRRRQRSCSKRRDELPPRRRPPQGGSVSNSTAERLMGQLASSKNKVENSRIRNAEQPGPRFSAA